jgi:phage-related protein
MPTHQDPFWPWCPEPGMSKAATLRVDSALYGDGYVHRATRGLNPVGYQYTLIFPFTTGKDCQDMQDFLATNGAKGFWTYPPDQANWLGTDIFVTCDSWTFTFNDRNVLVSPIKGPTIIGTLQAIFDRRFNPQPS